MGSDGLGVCSQHESHVANSQPPGRGLGQPARGPRSRATRRSTGRAPRGWPGGARGRELAQNPLALQTSCFFSKPPHSELPHEAHRAPGTQWALIVELPQPRGSSYREAVQLSPAQGRRAWAVHSLSAHNCTHVGKDCGVHAAPTAGSKSHAGWQLQLSGVSYIFYMQFGFTNIHPPDECFPL